MKISEIIPKIEELLEQVMPPDPPDDENPAAADDLITRFKDLHLKRDELLESLATLALDTRDDIMNLKTEESRLKARRQHLTGKRERVMSVLDRECGGEKTDLGVATLYYRKTCRTVITDEEAAFEWLKEHGHRECYRIPKPEISKAAVSRLLDAGYVIPGAERQNGTTCYLK